MSPYAMTAATRKILAAVVGAVLLLPAVGAGAAGYGGQEHVKLLDGPTLEITATLDPGEPTSTLYAYNISYFTRDSQTWASFVVDNGSVLPGQRALLKLQVLRDQEVRLRNGGREHRPTVELRYCLGSRSYQSRVSLLPRSGYTPSLVLGQNALTGLGSIDPTRKFTVEPTCPKPAAAAPDQP